MRDCQNLQRFLDNSLSPDEQASFEAHLGDCAQCSEQSRNVAFASHSLRAHVEMEEQAWQQRSAHLQEIHDRLKNEGTPVSSRRILKSNVAVLVAASVAIVMAAVLWKAQLSSRTPTSITSTPSAGAIATQLTPEPPPSTALPSWETASEESRIVEYRGQRFGIGPDTKLHVASLDGTHLTLKLHRGTAAFDITRSAALSAFTVTTDHISVQVVGTQFSVDHTPPATEVVVGHGEVAINPIAGHDGPGQNLRAGSLYRMATAPKREETISDASTTQLERIDNLLQLTSPKSIPTPKPRVVRKPDGHSAHKLTDLVEIKKMIARGELKNADAALSERLDARPSDVSARLLEGDLRQKEQRWSDAVSSYKRAGTTGSGKDARRALYKAGVILQDRFADHAAALSLLERYTRAQSSGMLVSDALLRQAKALGALGRHNQKDAVLNRLLTDHPGTPAALSARKLLTR